MARELGGGVPRTRAAPHGDREEMPHPRGPPELLRSRREGLLDSRRPASATLGLPRPLPCRAAGASWEPVSHPLRPQQLAPRRPPGEFLSHPAARLFLQPRGWDPGWGGRASGTAPAADQLGWGRPRAARGPARRRGAAAPEPPGPAHSAPEAQAGWTGPGSNPSLRGGVGEGD